MAQWLRCCATNRKVAGSISDGVIGIFHWHKSLRSHYGPGVDSASNRNEYQEHFLWVKAACAWQPYHQPVPLSCNLGTLNSWKSLGHSRPVTGLLYVFTCFDILRHHQGVDILLSDKLHMFSECSCWMQRTNTVRTSTTECICSHKHTLITRKIVTSIGFYFIVNTTQYFNIIIIIIQCEAWSLSGGDHLWFKRNTTKKRPVTRDIHNL